MLTSGQRKIEGLTAGLKREQVVFEGAAAFHNANTLEELQTLPRGADSAAPIIAHPAPAYFSGLAGSRSLMAASERQAASGRTLAETMCVTSRASASARTRRHTQP